MGHGFIGHVFGRRDFIFAATFASLNTGALKKSVRAHETPRIEILDTRVISWKPPLYHGWPTLTLESQW